ncbi:hypothetical protein SESBI_14932 [Sesbania bispinosa]|nr:hypothetical protein SESBI_14932 [Sesbania bispinosa]
MEGEDGFPELRNQEVEILNQSPLIANNLLLVGEVDNAANQVGDHQENHNGLGQLFAINCEANATSPSGAYLKTIGDQVVSAFECDTMCQDVVGLSDCQVQLKTTGECDQVVRAFEVGLDTYDSCVDFRPRKQFGDSGLE